MIQKLDEIQIFANGGIISLKYVSDKINEMIDQLNEKEVAVIQDLRYKDNRKMLARAISHLRTQGYSYRAIADIIGLDHPQKVKHLESFSKSEDL